MKGQQIHIFATQADLAPLLRAIESQREFQFIRTGLFDSPIPYRLTSLLDDPQLGIAAKGDRNHEVRYLVAERTAAIEVRTVPQRSGDTKYAIDQMVNPQTIVFQPGGIFGETCVIAGNVSTISADEASLLIFKLFQREVRRQLNKIASYHVGKEAGELLDQGWRLTAGVTMPPLYDLRRSG